MERLRAIQLRHLLLVLMVTVSVAREGIWGWSMCIPLELAQETRESSRR